MCFLLTRLSHTRDDEEEVLGVGGSLVPRPILAGQHPPVRYDPDTSTRPHRSQRSQQFAHDDHEKHRWNADDLPSDRWLGYMSVKRGGVQTH